MCLSTPSVDELPWPLHLPNPRLCVFNNFLTPPHFSCFPTPLSSIKLQTPIFTTPFFPCNYKCPGVYGSSAFFSPLANRPPVSSPSPAPTPLSAYRPLSAFNCRLSTSFSNPFICHIYRKTKGNPQSVLVSRHPRARRLLLSGLTHASPPQSAPLPFAVDCQLSTVHFLLFASFPPPPPYTS